MKSLCFLVVLLCAWSIDCESIDYKKAAEIFKTLRISKLFSHARTNLTDPLAPADPASRFINFMRDHNRVYSSTQDLLQKHVNFVSNIEKAEHLQSLDRGTAQYSVNKFSDWSDDDLRHLTGLKLEAESSQSKHFQPDGFLKRLLNPKEDRPEKIKDDGSLPKAVDWREKNVISKVKQQGNCGCCYAFSVIGTVEGMHAIKTGQVTDLSEQQIVDCDSTNYGCKGGFLEYSLKYIMDAGGVVTEKEYPFVARKQKQCLKPKANTARVQVTGYKRIPDGREDVMRSWIAEYGPLSVAVNIKVITSYVRGVVDLDEYSCNPSELDHAVVAVGFGEERLKDGSTIPYWILKNSWGENWGEKGYFKVRRDRNICGISELVYAVATN